jgi:hypothetical protein
MNFNRKILIAIKTTTSKLMIGGLLFGIVILLSLRSRSIRSGIIFLVWLFIAVIAGGTIGGIVGFLTISVCALIALWMYKLGSKLISAWRVKPMESGSLYLPSSSILPSSRSPRSQLRIAGLTNRDDDPEIIVPYDYETADTDQIWSGDLDGIGDLTCQYNARSVLIRCAVHPGAATCEGCRDYQPHVTGNL